MFAARTQLPDIRPPSTHSSLPPDRNTRFYRLAAWTWTHCRGSPRSSRHTAAPRCRALLLCSPLSPREAPWCRYSQTRLSKFSHRRRIPLFRSATFPATWLDGGPLTCQRYGPIIGRRVSKLHQSQPVFGPAAVRRSPAADVSGVRSITVQPY